MLSSSGVVYARSAKFETPVGIQEGLVYPDAPYLLAGHVFDELRHISVLTCNDRKFQIAYSDGLPTVVRSKLSGDHKFRVHYTQQGRGPMAALGSHFQDSWNMMSDNPKAFEPLTKMFAYAVNWSTHQGCDETCRFCKLGKLQFSSRRKGLEDGELLRNNAYGNVIVGDLCTTWPSARDSETTFMALFDTNSRLYSVTTLTSKNSPKINTGMSTFVKTLTRARQLAKQKVMLPWTFHCDLGSEFVSNALHKCIGELGGSIEYAATGRHVAPAEAAVKTIAQGTRVTLAAGGLPYSFWAYAAKCFVHNLNLENPIYRRICIERGSPCVEGIFGRLCYVKLNKDQIDPATLENQKAMPAGTPCAFLSFDPTLTRRGAYVAFRKANGEFAVTTIDCGSRGEGIVWEPDGPDGRPCMAFEVVIQNLEVFHVSRSVRDVAASGFPGWTKEQKEEWSNNHPLSVSVSQPTAECKGCQNQRRKHTGVVGCRFYGIPEGPLRKEYQRRMGTRTELSEDILIDLRNRAAHQRIAVAAKAVVHDQYYPLVGGPRTPEPGTPDPEYMSPLDVKMADLVTRNGESRDSDSVVGDIGFAVPGNRPVEGKTVGLTPKDDPDAWWQIPRSFGTKGSVKGHPKQKALISKIAPFAHVWQEIEQSRVGVDWEGGYDSSHEVTFSPSYMTRYARTGCGDVGCSVKSLPRSCKRGFVTRKMTKQERDSDEGAKAQSSEFAKLFQRKLFAVPEDGKKIVDPDATVCSIAMLTHIKHAEKNIKDYVYKGRAVILGDNLRKFVQGTPILRWWEAMGSEVAALEQVRLLDAYATLNKFEIETVDLESAYLQAAWPDGVPKHYVTIPKHLWHLLPESHQPQHGNDFPVWRMDRAGYGHPASGHIWNDKLSSWLENNDWESARDGDESRCLFRKGNLLLATYVDDLKVTGPKDEMAAFWNHLRKDFDFKSKENTCFEFLGMQYRYDKGSIYLNLSDYCRDTIRMYETLWETTTKVSRTCGTDSLRVIKEQVPVQEPERRVQIMVGRLLWIARCNRPDLSHMVSALGTRVSRWDLKCDHQLALVMGYLLLTADLELAFKWEGDPSKALFNLHSDSDWLQPKSQSSFFSCVESADNSSCLPIHWGSKKQTICADSSTAAEIVAASFSIKTGARILLDLRAIQGRLSKLAQNENFTFLLDNNGAISHITKSPSDSVFFMNKGVCVRHCFLRDLFKREGMFGVAHVDTEKNRADVGTKVFTSTQSEGKAALVGLVKTEVLATADKPVERSFLWRYYNKRVIQTSKIRRSSVP